MNKLTHLSLVAYLLLVLDSHFPPVLIIEKNGDGSVNFQYFSLLRLSGWPPESTRHSTQMTIVEQKAGVESADWFKNSAKHPFRGNGEGAYHKNGDISANFKFFSLLFLSGHPSMSL